MFFPPDKFTIHFHPPLVLVHWQHSKCSSPSSPAEYPSRKAPHAPKEILQLLNPEKIILTGLLTESGDCYLDQGQAVMKVAVAGFPFSTPSIQLSKLGLDSGAIGAAALALQQ